MKKPHILIISQHFYPESFRINDIAREWVRRGYRVSVLTGIPNYPGGRFFPGYGFSKRRKENWQGVEIRRIPVIPRGHSTIGMVFDTFSFAASGFFWNLTTRQEADLVFSFETSPMNQVLVGCRYAKKHRVPHILYAQDLWPENVITVTGLKNRFIISRIDAMVDRIYRGCDRILVTSPSFAEAVKNRRVPVPAEKISYWPQYAEEFYRPMEREEAEAELKQAAAEGAGAALLQLIQDTAFRITFTGNIGYAQGLEILPQAAKFLKDTKTDTDRPVRFVIVGDGRNRQGFLAEIQKLGVEDWFHMIPRQPAERIPAILACSDAAFLSFADSPLWEKTIPAKLQSYMACGLPVLAAAGGETARIIKEADCGLCCSTGDARALAERIREMTEMTQESRTRLGANSRAYCTVHFDKQKLMDEMEGWIAG